MLVEPNAPQVVPHSRGADGGSGDAEVTGLDAALRLPDLGLDLPLSAIQDGFEFQPGPGVVVDNTHAG